MNDPFEVSRPAVSWKDARVGAKDGGEVVDAPELVQSRDYDTGDPAFWPDGNKKMAVVVPIRRADGSEAAFWAAKPSALFMAIGQAQKAAGRRIEPGGLLMVTYVGDKENLRNPRLNAAKQFTAVYTPPSSDPFADESGPTAHTTAPASAPATVPPVAAPIRMQIANFINAQMTDEQILAIPVVQAAGVTSAYIQMVRAQGPV